MRHAAAGACLGAPTRPADADRLVAVPAAPLPAHHTAKHGSCSLGRPTGPVADRFAPGAREHDAQ
ncbi:conserved hypothetical protein [Frankia sp. AiPs1]